MNRSLTKHPLGKYDPLMDAGKVRAGRRQPYTDRGIRRLKCVGCGASAHAMWQVCADGRVYRPICKLCDIALNRLVLEFMRDPEAAAKMRVYTHKVLHDDS